MGNGSSVTLVTTGQRSWSDGNFGDDRVDYQCTGLLV